MSSPDRGEVWLVDLGYVAKVRPCLVVSIPTLNQDRALVTLVAWHSLFNELTISRETVGAQRLAPDSMVKSLPQF